MISVIILGLAKNVSYLIDKQVCSGVSSKEGKLLKGIVHPKLKIPSSFTRPCLILNIILWSTEIMKNVYTNNICPLLSLHGKEKQVNQDLQV